MLGLACGDALGAPAEFLSPQLLRTRHGPLIDMVGSGKFGGAPGEWTDDTGMALCVAEGILEAPDDPVAAVGERFIAWQRTARDVGGTISAALNGLEGDWTEASRSTPQARDGREAGNGSLMQALPVALAYPDRREMFRHSARISAMTHRDPQAEICCAVCCLWVRALLEGDDLASAWSTALAEIRQLADLGRTSPNTPGPSPLPEEVWFSLNGASERTVAELQPTGYAGYVVDCLEAAVNRVLAEPSLEEALVALVNMGGETDTMAAVAGGVAGTHHGERGVPTRWLDALLDRDRIARIGRQLARLRHRRTFARPGLPELSFGTVVPGLAVGRNPLTTHDSETLIDSGVTAILDLREVREWTSPRVFGKEAVAALEWSGIERLHLPIPDGAPPGNDDLDRSCGFIDRHLAAHTGTVFVHCRAGVERTGAVVVADLACRWDLDYDEAVAASSPVALCCRQRPRIAFCRIMESPQELVFPGLQRCMRAPSGGSAKAPACGTYTSPTEVEIRLRYAPRENRADPPHRQEHDTR